MKKVNVKVKPKKVKNSSGRAYIVLMALSAAVCAFVFSFVLRPDKEVVPKAEVDISEVTPEEIAQVSEPVEIEIPKEKIPTPPPEKKTEPAEKIEPVEEEKTFDGKFSIPVDGEIINEYSASKPVKSKTTGEWRVHSGIDIKAPEGTSVKAPAGGKVIFSGEDRLTGMTVKIDHGDGFVSTLYNLEKINVSNGSQVKKGDTVGTVGTSAVLEAADDPHVHFEIKKDGKTISPKDYMQ